MTDEYDDFLSRVTKQAPSSGPVPVPAGSGVDEYDDFLARTGTPAHAAVADPYDDFAQRMGLGPQAQQQKRYFSTLGSLAAGGVKRNLEQWRAMPSSLRAVAADFQGDMETATTEARKAQGILQAAGESEWSLQKVHDAESFSYWLAEKLGEQGITALATLGTGGVAGLGTHAVGRTLMEKGLLSAAGNRALTLAGMGVPTYGLSTAMETAGTSQEQFEVTGSPQAGMSLGAGAAKGLLELWAPMSIARAMLRPGLQLGSTLPGAVGKIALKEGSTEAAQEAIDIAARKMSDPSYSYFKDGFTLAPSGWSDGMWRLVESGAAGAAVGGVYGAPFAGAERVQVRREQEGDLAPGERRTIQQESQLSKESSRVPLNLIPTKSSSDAESVSAKGLYREARNYDVPVSDAIKAAATTTSFGRNKAVGQGTIQAGLNALKPEQYQEFDIKRGNDLVGAIKLRIQGTLAFVDWAGSNTNLNTADIRDVIAGIKTAYPQVKQIGGMRRGNDGITYDRPQLLNVGPVTALRRAVMPPQAGDKLTQESRGVTGLDDALSLGPLLSTMPGAARDRFLDLVEANTERYVEGPPGAGNNRLYTDTEWELESAINRPQGQKPQLYRVRQGSLQSAMITATVQDLPPVQSGRVWFADKVPEIEKKRMLQEYVNLQSEAARTYGANLATAETRREFESRIGPAYDALVSRGLRVVPSRGGGFHYTGVVEGEPVSDLTSTQRSRKIALYNPVTQQVTPFVYESEESSRAMLEDIGASVPVSVDISKVRPEDVIELEGKSFKLKAPLDPSKLTPGFSFTHKADVEYMENLGRVSDWKVPRKSVVFMSDVLPEVQVLGKAIERRMKELLPALDRILRSVGLTKPLGIRITDNVSEEVGVSPAFVETDNGVITIVPSKLAKFVEANGLPLDQVSSFLLTLTMHELGHLVTFNHYRGLSVEVQEKLWYAHDKAKLAFRMGDLTRTTHPGMQSAPGVDQKYWTSFSEWLAEQFRRWSTTDSDAKGWVDAAFKDGAKQLERFYAAFEKEFGSQAAMNLAQPDHHFSAMMEYLKQNGSRAQQVVQGEAVKDAPGAGFAFQSPAAQRIRQQVELAFRTAQAAGIVPEGVGLRINQALDPHIVPGMVLPPSNAMARWVPQVNLIEVAVGAMEREGAVEASHSRQIISHELMHGFEDLEIISPEDIAILMRDIKGHETELFELKQQAALMKRIREYGEAHGWTQVQIQAKFERMRDKELRAYYIQRFADTGFAYSEQGKGIMGWILALIARIREFLQADGHRTAEDVMRAFFKGEMLKKWEPDAAPPRYGLSPLSYAASTITPDMADEQFDATYNVGGNTVGALYQFQHKLGDKKSAQFVQYTWINSKGEPIGYIQLNNMGPRGYEISWIETKSGVFALAQQMITFAEQDLGFKMKVAANLTEEGYKQTKVLMRMRDRIAGASVLDLYTEIDLPQKDGSSIKMWVSPHELKRRVGALAEAIRQNNTMAVFKLNTKQAINALTQYNNMLRRLDNQLAEWKDPRLDQMFSLRRNWERDEVQGSLTRAGQVREESQLMQAMGMGETQPDPWRENFELKQKLGQAANARASGLPFELSAPPSALTLEIRKLWERATGYGSSREAERELINIAHEGDRIGKFSKWWWNIEQLWWANQPKPNDPRPRNIEWLGDLISHKDQMAQLQHSWAKRADGRAREWRLVTNQQRRDGIMNILFALDEMTYRTPAEVAAKVERFPTGWAEFMAGQPPPQGSELYMEFRKAKVKMADHQLIREIQGDFAAFLVDVEKVSVDVFTRKFQNSPAVLQQALTQLAADMAKYRSKPYFPSMRFGEFTIVVRERNRVVWSSAYPTIAQRDSALTQVRRDFPLGDIQIGRISASQAEFMSLPGPLIKLIKENLFDKAGKTPEQIALIDKQIAEMEELELLHMPDRTFRRRWMPSQGVPGYSKDAFRSYAHYFQYGSRYLARMAYMDQLQNDIARGRATIGLFGNYAKRAEIVRYADEWLRYILEPGRDSGKFRAIVSFWYLAFSPAAAFMNLTQNITTTWPWLSGQFGTSVANGAVVRATNARLWGRGQTPAEADAFQRAYEEMVRQGFIDMGQAPELAAFAEGHNLHRLMASSKLQESWSNLQYYGMAMFSAAEAFNRNVAMRSAWAMAIENQKLSYAKQAEQLKVISRDRLMEIGELVSRVGLTHDQAVAFLFARETIKRTQFVYDKTSDPPFMRGLSKDFLIFFKYTQGMLFAFGHNGAPIQMLLVMAVLYGLAGVPGAEDANEVLKLIGQRLFGKDFDVLKMARTLIRDITRGSWFDQTGPDLAMHGISRFGFGLGLLPDFWAVPKFDASANGAMGRLVPGLYEVAHGLNTGQKFSDVFGQSAQRVMGAGYGTFYTMAQVLTAAPSAESHQWEQLLQRQMKALAQGYRYAVNPQAETTRSGAKIVQFKLDASDPDDVATVLAQFAGFKPTKVNQTWDLVRATREEMAVWDLRRKALYVQFDRVLSEQPVNPQALEDMLKGIRQYNTDVPDPAMAIKAQELQQSLRQRHRARAMQEQTLGANRREAIVTDRMKDLYPGVMEQRVK